MDFENVTDLTSYQNESIFIFAKQLFAKNVNNLDVDRLGLFLDETMCTEDIFCMLLELVLYGIHILVPGKTVFDLDDIDNVIVDILTKYLRSIRIKLIIEEVYLTDTIHQYLREAEYYCLILKNIITPWKVLDYKMQINFNPQQRVHDSKRELKNFIAYFTGQDNKLFSLSFTYVI